MSVCLEILVAIMTLGAALASAWAATRASQIAKESFDWSKKQNRPEVLISLSQSGDGDYVYITLENIGNKPAFKVRTTITPDIFLTNSQGKSDIKVSRGFTAEEIGVLNPGEKLWQYWGPKIEVQNYLISSNYSASIRYSQAEGSILPIDEFSTGRQFIPQLLSPSGGDIASISRQIINCSRKLEAINNTLMRRPR